MWKDVREVVTGALAQLSRNVRDLAITDLAFRLIAFALLSPLAALILRWAMARVDRGVLADVDIARFFVTTRAGFFALLGMSTVVIAITALEASSLMAVGLAGMRGRYLLPRHALAFAGTKAGHVLALSAHMVLRILVGLVPFLLAGGLVYALLLREHDINYYISDRPPEFWIAVVLVGVIGAGLVALLLRTIARWSLALQLVLFENVPPRRALGASAARTKGHRAAILVVLATWLVFALVTTALVTVIVDFVGRSIAPLLAHRLGLLLLFVTALLLLWAALALAVAVVNASLFALALAGLYERVGDARPAHVPGTTVAEPEQRWKISGRAWAAVAGVVVLGFVGLTLLVLFVTSRTREVAVIAHRGSSRMAPENSLSAFRLAIEEGADYVEFDVQESADGEVVVAHDLDLMKVGGSPLKVFETSLEDLRKVPIGRRADPKYADERIPTLRETLALCKGRVKVIIELKSYGHDQKLEERVAQLVEEAGMVDDSVFMSLDHKMAARMKKLRPEWRVGILVAKAVGDVTTLEADFVAVEARMATARFVRRNRRAGRDIYVWTVNDPAWMLTTMSRGVDGLITDVPEVARKVIDRRNAMSDTQRFLVALLIRLGAHTDALAKEDALRP